MLETLDDHPWDHIHHAYGTCENAPRMLRDLAAGNKNAGRTLGWLDGCCFHQETHYEANAHLMPYLLEIATSPSVPHRDALFQFLLRWFCADESCQPPKSPAQRTEWLEKHDEPSMFYGLDSSEYWRRMKDDALGAAWRNRHYLLDALSGDPVPRFRATAGALLAQLVLFGQHVGRSWWEDQPTSWFDLGSAAEMAGELAKAARSDEDPPARVAALLSLGAMRDVSRAAELSFECWVQAESALQRTAAATACLVSRTPAPSAAVSDFVEGATRGLLFDESLHIVPWLMEEGVDQSPVAQQIDLRLGAWISASTCRAEDLLSAIDKASKRPEPERRRTAISLLRWLPGLPPRYVARLSKHLVDDDPLVRCRAAQAIHQHAPPPRVLELVDAFRAALTSPNVNVRAEGLDILGQMYTDLYPNEGRDEVDDEPSPPADDPRSPEGYPAWLSSRPLPMAVPLLAETASQETDDENCRRYSELISRAKIECQEVVSDRQVSLPAEAEVRRLARTWCDAPTRVAMGMRISFSGSYHDPSPFTDAEVMRLSERWMHWIRQNHPQSSELTRCLGRLKSPLVLPMLIELLNDVDRDIRVREHACYAIRWIDKQEAAWPSVVAALPTASRELAGDIACYFRITRLGINCEAAAERLIDAVVNNVQTPDGTRLREILPPALGELEVRRAEAARALVMVASTDAESRVRRVAAHSLADKFPDELLQEYCLPQVQTWDTDALQGFLEPFAQRRKMFPSLAAMATGKWLSHADHRVRSATVRALGRVPADAPRQRAVAALLRDPHESVRTQVIWWDFSDLEQSEYAPSLITMVTGDSPFEYAWTPITKLDLDAETMIATSRAALRGPDELVSRVCEWLAGHPLPQLAADFRELLRKPSLSLKSRYHLLEAWWAAEPTAKSEILAAMTPAENFPLRSVVNEFRELREKIEAGADIE
jgi:HEAT repeat protein